MKKRCLVVTGGGDCPGLNAVIRAIVRRASQEKDWEIIGSRDAFNGILSDPMEIEHLTERSVAGIHYRGGTILGTTNRGGPFAYPTKDENGKLIMIDRSTDLMQRIQDLNIQGVINIGGDGSQTISQQLFELGCKIIGVPKTIDNDLSATDYTFGFQTAVEIATEALDKLVTTAASHHRIIILEVMGREAGWIALHTALAGGAEICLIPEIPYDIIRIISTLEDRIKCKRGFANIVIAEGARSVSDNSDIEDESAGIFLMKKLKTYNLAAEIRLAVLGHIQRGGIPIAFDRILATQFGVKAFELVLENDFGKMVAYHHPDIVAVPIISAIKNYNFVDIDSNLVKTARGIGINFGD